MRRDEVVEVVKCIEPLYFFGVTITRAQYYQLAFHTAIIFLQNVKQHKTWKRSLVLSIIGLGQIICLYQTSQIQNDHNPLCEYLVCKYIDSFQDLFEAVCISISSIEESSTRKVSSSSQNSFLTCDRVKRGTLAEIIE